MKRKLSPAQYTAIVTRIQGVLKAQDETAYGLAKRLGIPVPHAYDALAATPRRPGLLLRMAHELAIETEAAA